MQEIYYPENQLAKQIADTMLGIQFGDGISLVPVTSTELATQLHDPRETCRLDYRAKAYAVHGFSSVTDGLAFNQYKLRSQAFCLRESNTLVGIMSFIIAPTSWISQQRYILQVDGGAKVVDAHTITGKLLPDYYIIPAMTRVVDTHLGEFAHQGYHAFRQVMDLLIERAPPNTWIELSVIGINNKQKRMTLIGLVNQCQVGDLIAENDFPFPLSSIGLPYHKSRSSERVAILMGLSKISNLGSGVSLGPVYAKELMRE